MRILYLVAHETLEYDDIRMFTHLGHRVFSLGSFANPNGAKPSTRPTRPEYFMPDMWETFAADPDCDLVARKVSASFAARFDIAIVNHYPEWITRNREAFGAMPVIYRALGQSNLQTEALLRQHEDRVRIVRYSRREVGLPGFCRTDDVIYFAKFLDDYQPWASCGRVVTFHNSYPTRSGVSVPTLEQYAATADDRYDLFGFDNAGVTGWRGLAPPDLQHAIYRAAGVYLYVYTVPPSYTLSVIEAMLTGTPVLAPSAKGVRATLGAIADQCGFSEERYEVPELLDHQPDLLWDSVEEIPGKVDALLSQPARATAASMRLRARASGVFDVVRVAPRWRDLLDGLIRPCS